MTVLSNLQVAIDLPNFADAEVPLPGPAGSNTWTLAFAPAGTPLVFSNGLLQNPGTAGDYTIAGNVLTSTLWAGQGGNLLAFYRH